MMSLIARLLATMTQSRVWRWWTLKNWKDAADVAVKLAAILGAIAAANFFVLKPDLTWVVEYCLRIDPNSIEEAFNQEGIPLPTPVSNQSEIIACDVDQLPSPLASSGAFTTPFADQAGGLLDVSPLVVNLAAIYESIPDPVETMIREHYGLTDEVWNGTWISAIPIVARWLLQISDQLTTNEFGLLLEAMDASQYYTATVLVMNQGQATARSVQVEAPEGWTLQSNRNFAFDLPPGARADIAYAGEVDVISPGVTWQGSWYSAVDVLSSLQTSSAASSPAFIVTWDHSEILDRGTISKIGIAFLVLWTMTILKDVFDYTRLPQH